MLIFQTSLFPTPSELQNYRPGQQTKASLTSITSLRKKYWLTFCLLTYFILLSLILHIPIPAPLHFPCHSFHFFFLPFLLIINMFTYTILKICILSHKQPFLYVFVISNYFLKCIKMSINLNILKYYCFYLLSHLWAIMVIVVSKRLSNKNLSIKGEKLSIPTCTQIIMQ